MRVLICFVESVFAWEIWYNWGSQSSYDLKVLNDLKVFGSLKVHNSRKELNYFDVLDR